MFTQPVAMKASKEQFEKDLKTPLEKMGYEINCSYDDDSESNTLITSTVNKNGYVNLLSSIFFIYDFLGEKGKKFHFIENYDPTLFLHLASLNDDEEIKEEDMVIFDVDIAEKIGLKTSAWDKPFLLKVDRDMKNDFEFSKEQGRKIKGKLQVGLSFSNNTECFRKATKEDILHYHKYHKDLFANDYEDVVVESKESEKEIIGFRIKSGLSEEDNAGLISLLKYKWNLNIIPKEFIESKEGIFMKNAGLIEKYFAPVYKENQVIIMHNIFEDQMFNVAISPDGIVIVDSKGVWRRTITDEIEDIVNFFNKDNICINSARIYLRLIAIEDVVFKSIDLINSKSKLSDWIKVWEKYSELKRGEK